MSFAYKNPEHLYCIFYFPVFQALDFLKESLKSVFLKMKEAIVAKGPKVTIQDVPIPKPNADQVRSKVFISYPNPK